MKSTNQKKIFRSDAEGTKKLTKSAQRKLTATCIGIIAIALILLGAGLTYFQKNRGEENTASFEEMQNSLRGQMQEEMTTASAYLEKLDGSIAENQKKLEEMCAQLTERQKSFLEAESAQKKLNENTSEVSLKVNELEKKTENQIRTLLQNMDFVQEDIQTTLEKISAIITEMEQDRKEINGDHEQSLSEINRVNTSVQEVNQPVKEVEEELSKSYESLKTFLRQLQAEETENQEEMIQQLAELEQRLKSILEADMRQITEAFAKITVDFEQQLARLSELMDGKLEALDQNVEGNFANLGQNVNSQFENLDQNVSGGFASLGQDISGNLANLGQDVNGRFENLDQSLKGSLSGLDQNLGSRFEKMEQDMAGKFQTMNQTLVRQIADLAVSSGQENENLKEYLEALGNSLSQDLNQVFISVSNGKKELASALLTKGVTAKEDATFAQIRDAILNIDQKLVIGVQEIPGTITYQYHYHQDASGQNPHTDFSTAEGGCYTIPAGHIHSVESGCYRIENYHVHTGECPQKPVWVDWVENPYWGAEYTCGNSPSNATRKVLECTKTESDIEFYMPSCGLADGQIIGAQIVYDRNAVEAMAATAPVRTTEEKAAAQQDEEEPGLPARASEELLKEMKQKDQEAQDLREEERVTRPEEAPETDGTVREAAGETSETDGTVREAAGETSETDGTVRETAKEAVEPEEPESVAGETEALPE